MTLHLMSKNRSRTTDEPSRTAAFLDALRLLPAGRIRAGAPVHPSLRHLAGDPEITRS